MRKNAVIPQDWPLSIVGLGAVGSRLARAFQEAGVQNLILVGEGLPGEQRLSKALKVSYLKNLRRLSQESGVVVLALHQPQIASTVHDLAGLSLPWPKLSVLHTSGAVGADLLQPLARLGAGVAAWHPYQTFPRKAKRVELAGVSFGISGNRKGISAANRLTRLLGGVPLRISDQDRVLYHLSAVLACGFVAADLQMAIEVLKRIGIPEPRALEAVLPIARETLRQVEELGVSAAQTGPAVRGDQAAIRKHLAALRKTAPELVKVYADMTRYILKTKI